MPPLPLAPGADARSVARLDRDRSLLLLVDIQERLAPSVHDQAAVIARSEALLAAARRMRIPCVLTEHCANRIGPVIARLRERFDPTEIVGKTHFAATDHPEFTALLRAHGRTQVVVAGMEAHVCVLQTVLGLAAEGFEVFVAGDAVGSRGARDLDRTFALERMRVAGCAVAGTETLLFEWTRAGDDDAFREVLALVKHLPESGPAD
jgi:nicotinamidase-related amidase